MSYSVFTPCFGCEKKETCTDGKTIYEAVQNEIHTKTFEEGHQGCGSIALTCTRVVRKEDK